MPCQNLVVGEKIVLHRAGILSGIGGVHAVHIFGKQNRVRFNFHAPEHRARIRGEIGIAGAAGKKHHFPLLQIPLGGVSGEVLGKLVHFHSGKHPRVHAHMLQHIGYRNAVHHRAQHSHVVCMASLHFIRAVFHAPPEIACANYNAYLHAHLGASGNHLTDLTQNVKIQTTALFSRQRLAADFQQHSFILYWGHRNPLLYIYVSSPIL